MKYNQDPQNIIVDDQGGLTAGLINPTGPLPASILASLIRVIIEATTGAEADVPKTKLNSPSMAIT